MSKEFDLIKCLTSNKGQGTLVWMLNIGIEEIWNGEKSRTIVTDKEENNIVNKTEEINLLLTRKQDYIILRKKPSEAFLNYLQQIGFEIPNLLIPEHYDLDKNISELVLSDESLLSILTEIAKKDDAYFVPYGVTELEEKIASKCDMKIIGAISELNKKVSNKVYARNIGIKLGFRVPKGIICSSIKDVEKAYYAIAQDSSKVIIKSTCESSGKGLFVVQNEEKLKLALMILERETKKQKKYEWIVEKWYDNKRDINYQVYISPTGRIRIFSIKEQIIDNTVYVGSLVPPRISNKIKSEIIECGKRIGNELYLKGYSGILGIDALLIDNEILIPILEINARFTLSTYLSFLSDKYPNRLIISLYERIHLNQNVNYEMLQSFLERERICFNLQLSKGIIIYNESSLQLEDSVNRGRMFFIIISSNFIEFREYQNKLVKYMQEYHHDMRCFSKIIY